MTETSERLKLVFVLIFYSSDLVTRKTITGAYSVFMDNEKTVDSLL